MQSFPKQKIYRYNSQYLQYDIIWGIVFPVYQKLLLLIIFYLSQDKLAKKIYLSDKLFVWVGRGNSSTPLT